ncbi:NADPH:quinone oxidoreductase family protein [uncultured Pseudoteredinibacter sp.]|uniref:NADPH:quinone oxidoreductase family protein n=1 Tax=uncultured Pseudoteredinibacter sp. TaxID=1641701 RepID=UPI002639F0B0|nr:NADPH:quinone oxidoreductase family protein [uncultured Pseudoteredinibacter sp.]
MNVNTLPTGRRALVSEFAEDPVKAVNEHIALEDQAVPDTSSLQAQDIIVQVKSAAVGWVDLLMTSGLYQHTPPPPYSPGLEYSGIVVWVGADVDSKQVAVGDRVLVDGFQAGPRSAGNYQQYGGFASYAVAPARASHKIPADFGFAEACNLLGSYETAYHCLVTRGQLKAGETVLIHGASGATGMAAVHIAKLLGATVIATGRSDAKLKVVQEQGADHIINCKDPNHPKGVTRFRDEVKALTDGKGVDVVYDGVGGAISLESMRCVKFNARFLVVGWAATPFVAKGEKGESNANMLPTNLIMMKSLQVLGCPTVISTQFDPSSRAPRFNQIMQWVSEGKIKPFISHQFSLDQVREALLAKWNGDVIGGCAINLPEL